MNPSEIFGQSSPGGIKTEHGGCLQGGKERQESAGEGESGVYSGIGDQLECDDDMSCTRHRVRGLSVDGKVVVLPEDVGFVWLGGRIEGRGV